MPRCLCNARSLLALCAAVKQEAAPDACRHLDWLHTASPRRPWVWLKPTPSVGHLTALPTPCHPPAVHRTPRQQLKSCSRAAPPLPCCACRCSCAPAERRARRWHSPGRRSLALRRRGGCPAYASGLLRVHGCWYRRCCGIRRCCACWGAVLAPAQQRQAIFPRRRRGPRTVFHSLIKLLLVGADTKAVKWRQAQRHPSVWGGCAAFWHQQE